MVHRLSRLNRTWLLVGGGLLVAGLGIASQAAADSSTYGMGTYGSCTYNTCGVSLTSSGAVSLNITPLSGTSCTVASDSLSVLTDSSSGYTLKFTDGDTDNNLIGTASGTTIAAIGSTASAPAALAAGQWGYRVDNLGSFGAGPTSAESSGSTPSTTFAAVPISSATPDTLATSSVAADPAVTTTIWYGLCVDGTQKADTYTDSVTYTAVVN